MTDLPPVETCMMNSICDWCKSAPGCFRRPDQPHKNSPPFGETITDLRSKLKEAEDKIKKQGRLLEILKAHHQAEIMVLRVNLNRAEVTDPKPQTLIEQEESTLRGRLNMARARYENAQEAFDEAKRRGQNVDAPIIPRTPRPPRREK
jgi:glutaredoxin